MAFVSDAGQGGQTRTPRVSTQLVLFMVDTSHAGGASQCFIII